MEAWEAHCLVLLSEMQTGNEQKWSGGKEQLYLVVLRSMGEQWSRAAVQHAILTEEWRPAPAKLRQIAAILASPLPAGEALWVEMWHKIIHVEYGEPDWTHPLLADIAAALGSWGYLRAHYWHDTEAFQIEALHRRFTAAQQEAAAAWWEQVAQQLGLPDGLREARLFPALRSFVAPPSLPPGDVIYALPPADEFLAQGRPAWLHDLKDKRSWLQLREPPTAKSSDALPGAELFAPEIVSAEEQERRRRVKEQRDAIVGRHYPDRER